MTPAHERKQRAVPQGIGVILVLVAAGNLQDALAQQERQAVPHGATAPLAQLLAQRLRLTQLVVGVCQPDQAATRGELSGVTADRERGCARQGARISHE